MNDIKGRESRRRRVHFFTFRNRCSLGRTSLLGDRYPVAASSPLTRVAALGRCFSWVCLALPLPSPTRTPFLPRSQSQPFAGSVAKRGKVPLGLSPVYV